MIAILGMASILGFLYFFIAMIVFSIKKKPVKKSVIGLAVSFGVLVVAVLITPDPTASSVTKEPASVQQSASAQETSSSVSSVAETAPEETIAGVGETLDYKGLKITLNSIEQYKDESEFQIDKSADGNIFILLNFTASNQTGKDDLINMFYEDSYCDDVSIDPEAILFNAKGETIFGNIANGKKRKGYVAYQVPANWESIEFYYNPETFSGNSNKMMFKANASDLK